MAAPIPQRNVDSSLCKCVGHCPTTNTLAVTHHDGACYHYKDVPPALFQKLLRAESIGSFLHKNIRGQYEHTKQRN